MAQHILRCQGIDYVLVVMEVAVVDDSRIERFRVFLHYLVCLLRDHARRTSVLGVDCFTVVENTSHLALLTRVLTIMIQIVDDLGEVLLRFFVQVGDGDTRREDCVVRVLRREIRRGF